MAALSVECLPRLARLFRSNSGPASRLDRFAVGHSVISPEHFMAGRLASKLFMHVGTFADYIFRVTILSPAPLNRLITAPTEVLATPIRRRMDDLYRLMHRRGLTTIQRHFSAHWCDRAPNYLALGTGLSEGAKIAIFRRLVSEGRCLLAVRVAHMILFARSGR